MSESVTLAVDCEELVDAHTALAGHAEALRDTMWMGRPFTWPRSDPT